MGFRSNGYNGNIDEDLVLPTSLQRYQSNADCDTTLVQMKKVFGSRLSGLTIDDECKYNLAYLLAHKNARNSLNYDVPFQSVWSVASKSVSHDLLIEDRMSRNIVVDHRRKLDEKRNPKPRSRRISPPRQKSNSLLSVSHVPYDDSMNKQATMKLRTPTIERSMNISPALPRRAFVTTHQAMESPYSGVHIYVTESPPRSYYEMVPAYESPSTKQHCKTVACDPIRSVSSGTPKSHKSINRLSLSADGGAKQINNSIPEHQIFNRVRSSTIASKVEAFSTMVQPARRFTPQGVPYNRQSPQGIYEGRITSPEASLLTC